jgi:hypothetical protein
MGTMDITTRAMPHIMAPKNRYLVVAIVTLLACQLVVLAVPSLIASTVTLQYNETLEDVRILRKGARTAGELADAARANEHAAKFFDSGRYRANVAAALVAMSAADRASSGLDLEREVRLSLETAPASTYNWNRLAVLRYSRGDRAGALKAWEMSILTGRYAPNLVNARIDLAIRMFPITDRSLVEMLIDQVRLSGDANLVELARVAHLAGGAPFVQAVLWQDTDLGPAFDDAYHFLLRKDRNRYLRSIGR